MSYASQADLEARFGAVELAQLTDRVNGTVIDAAVLADALADADAEINGYLAVRYATPVADVPTLLVRLACDITRYRLYDERTTEAVRQRYEDCRRVLKDLSSGAVLLVGAQFNTPAAVNTEAKVQSRAPDRQFGPDQLANY